MASRLAFLLFLPFLLLPLAASHNITRILGQFSDFSTFSSLLNQAQLVPQINSRSTITVLAVNNDAVSSLSSKPADDVKKILSVHVILDYYDDDKLRQLSKRSAIVTTLFQATGLATGQNGFLNVTDLDNGQVAFGSAVPGSPLNANFVKVLATRPYNISVLQISSVIVPPSIGGGGASSNQSAAPPKASSAAPKAAPAPGNATSSKPAPSPSTDAESPADGPSADAPTSDSPVSSPPAPAGPDGSPAGAPSADGPEGDSPAGAPLSTADAPALVVGAGVAVVAMGFAMLASL